MDQPRLNDEIIEKVLNMAEDLGEGTESLSVEKTKISKQETKPFCPNCKDENPLETMIEKKVSVFVQIGEDKRVFKLSLYICPKCKSYFAW